MQWIYSQKHTQKIKPGFAQHKNIFQQTKKTKKTRKNQQTKLEKPNIVNIKPSIIEHPNTSQKLSKTINQGWLDYWFSHILYY